MVESSELRLNEALKALRAIDLRGLPLRHQDEDETDYFLRAIGHLKAIARQALNRLGTPA